MNTHNDTWIEITVFAGFQSIPNLVPDDPVATLVPHRVHMGRRQASRAGASITIGMGCTFVPEGIQTALD